MTFVCCILLDTRDVDVLLNSYSEISLCSSGSACGNVEISDSKTVVGLLVCLFFLMISTFNYWSVKYIGNSCVSTVTSPLRLYSWSCELVQTQQQQSAELEHSNVQSCPGIKKVRSGKFVGTLQDPSVAKWGVCLAVVWRPAIWVE